MGRQQLSLPPSPLSPPRHRCNNIREERRTNKEDASSLLSCDAAGRTSQGRPTRRGGTAKTDTTVIEGVRGGARPPTPRSVEAEGRRQGAELAPSMAWRDRPRPGSELLCDERRGELQTHGSTHLSNGSGLLYCIISADGDGLLPREPSEVDDADEPVIVSQILLTNGDLKLTVRGNRRRGERLRV